MDLKDISLNNINKAHFIGIGGIGMSALAFALLAKGKKVTGTDKKASNITDKLIEMGAKVNIDHNEKNLDDDTNIVVVSTAINNTNNPELEKANRLNIPIYHRADLLNAFLRSHESIAVTGTHGKTSTSAMMSQVLYEANLNPTALVGGQIISFGTNSLAGDSNYLVAEVDESDKSINKLSASYAIITNLESDHLDHYKDFNEILSVMKQFIDNIPKDGKIIICKDSEGNRELLKMITDRDVITYGEKEKSSDYVVIDIEQTDSSSKFKVLERGVLLGEFFMHIAGKHYIHNAISVIICSRLLGISVEDIKKGLVNYQGVKRRFERVADKDGSIIIDDYAHHPTEIRATLSTSGLFKRHVTVAFQPHRFSRTKAFMEEFAKSFEEADRVILTDVYGAGEKQEDYPEITSENLAKMVKSYYPNKEVYYLPSLEEIATFMEKNKVKDEIIITMGAGTITNLSKMLIGDMHAIA